jgi:riboflavin synthase
MFTGLIREIGKVVSLKDDLLTIKANHKTNLGDSIAVNGVCLTVVKFDNTSFTVQLSKETQNIIAIENYKNQVHIEPAMRLSDRLEGHIVQGHVDTLGTITKIEQLEKAYNYYIKIDKKFMKYIVPKGSITIDGVSLTINDVKENTFRLTIIPHTIKETIFKNYKIGTKVNIETDMFARYIEHILKFKKDEDKLNWGEVNNIMASY